MEQWLPYERQWNRSLGDRRRGLHALVNESLVTAGLLILPGLTALLAVERLATGLAAVGATVTGHRARRRRYHPDALRQPPHRAAVALACGASQRATVVWIQWFDETPFAPDAQGSHCWAAAVDPAGHSVGRGAVAGLGDCHSVAVAALQCGHARGALALGIRVGAELHRFTI